MVNWGRAFASLAQRFGGKPAVVTEDGAMSFDELVGRAAALSHALRRRAGGDEPVATLLPNSAQAVVGSYGVLMSGAAETALNPGFGIPEIKYCVELLGIRHIVTVARLAESVQAAGCEPLLVESLGDQRATPDVDAPAPAAHRGKILFTSGTTGKPKAIFHSQERRWLANLMLRAHLPFTPSPDNRILLMTPFSHGASLLTAAFHDCGASIHLLDGVDVEGVRRLLADGTVDCMFAPPTMLAKLTSLLDGFTCNTLRTIFTGTATLTPTLYRRVQAMFGPVVRVTYGKTEVFNPITVLQPAECHAAYENEGEQGAANLGWPASGVEIEIRGENGAPCAIGVAGRIFIRAPHMMVGYMDEDGYHVVAPDEWHESGDIGYLGARGELMLCGRDHDMIKTGGYKMFPREVEAPIEAAGACDEVIALGLPSQYWGEILVVAAERPTEGWEQRAECSLEGLSRHKKPRAYLAVAEFPRNAQGKVQRSELRERLLRQYRIEDGPHPQLIRISDDDIA
jgi:malonyl-CoA/methylmalonyl-CoA synthetase